MHGDAREVVALARCHGVRTGSCCWEDTAIGALPFLPLGVRGIAALALRSPEAGAAAQTRASPVDSGLSPPVSSAHAGRGGTQLMELRVGQPSPRPRQEHSLSALRLKPQARCGRVAASRVFPRRAGPRGLQVF